MKYLMLFLLVFHCATGMAQKKDSDQSPVYTAVNEAPEFPGGYDAFRKYLAAHIEYPRAALDTGAMGTVYISIVIDSSGNVTNAKILRDPVGYGCGEEALRVVKMMPAWKPGKMNGRKVSTRYTIPVKFVLK
jgi:periplasmic protein TonB